VPLGYAALLKIIKKRCKIKGSKLGGTCLALAHKQENIEFEERAKSFSPYCNYLKIIKRGKNAIQN
jgi:hypothetical protein